jgi:hypothetical protein
MPVNSIAPWPRTLPARAGPQPDIPHRRHDAAEDPAAEHVHRLGLIDEPQALLDRQAEPLPDFELVEAVAHVPARGDDELLALEALGIPKAAGNNRATRSGQRRDNATPSIRICMVG